MDLVKQKYYELTHPQKRIWYIDKINVDSPLHNIGGTLKFNGHIDVDKLKKAINYTIQSNDALRMRFFEKDGEPFQYISNFETEDIDFFDFTTQNSPEKKTEEWLESLFKRKFELGENKLYYFSIYKISDEEYGLVLAIHHIIADGWSVGIIQKQVCECYRNMLSGINKSISMNSSYLDFIKSENKYLNSEKFLKNKAFWKDKFDDFPKEFLYKSSDNLEGKRKIYNIDSNLSNRMNEFLRINKYSLNDFILACSLIYLSKTTNQSDITIGTPIFNRIGKEQRSMVGMFTSTLPFRIKLYNELTFEELILRINREKKSCYRNQKYPYDLLIKDLKLYKKGYDSLFKMSVNCYNSEFVSDIDGMDLEVEEYYNGNQNYSLQLIVKKFKENISLSFDYKESEYTEETISMMLNSIINIIYQVIETKNIKLKNLQLLNQKLLLKKIFNLNSTKYDYSINNTIHELFELQVLKNPHKTAVYFDEESLTYNQLNEKSNQLANYLKERGIKRGSVVAIMASHSFELIVGILAILKSGGSYVPIDPGYPIGRVEYMLEDSNSEMLITDIHNVCQLNFKGSIVNLKKNNFDTYCKKNLDVLSTPSDIAYIIYTSGSTGKPKGVMIEQKGLVNYSCWARRKYIKDENEIFAFYSSISFDLTITSIFTPLISGTSIRVYANDENEFVLYKILRENKSTLIKLTPSHLSLLKDLNDKNSSIRTFIVGGEDLKTSLAKEIYETFNRDIDIFNEYGPTETVVGCMLYKYNPLNDVRTSIPIGSPADNVQVYILNKDLNVLPDGIPGEIYISGDGVARGYLNMDEMTKERFLNNPFLNGQRMYKTGDIGKYLPDGTIEYLGRADSQIKIRGHRIEIAEIERCLLEHKHVNDVVVYSNNSTNLIAYIISEKQITTFEMKKWLSKYLPHYMLPNNYIFVERFPLTINGKIDFSLLPTGRLEKEYIVGKTDIEKELVKIISDVLKVEKLSMDDNFYHLGGDSIKAIQIAGKLNNVGLELKVNNILSSENILEISRYITKKEFNTVIDKDEYIGEIAETPITNWFFSQKFNNDNHYNQHVLIELVKEVSIETIKKAVSHLINQHDMLRVNFNRKSSTLFYNPKYLGDANLVNFVDLSKENKDIQDELINSYLKTEFNLENSINFKLHVFNLGGRGQALLFIVHHIMVDGISWRILLEDFFSAINYIKNNEQVILPPKTNSYKKWASFLNEYSKQDFKEEKYYWSSILNKNFGNLEAPVEDKHIEKDSLTITRHIDKDYIVESIKKANEVYNVDLNEVLIIGLVLTLNNISRSKEIVIELERHGRENISDLVDVSRTIGWFTNLFPVYFNIEENNLENSIKSIKEQLRKIPNKGFNYNVLRYLKNELNGTFKKYVRFNYMGDFDNLLKQKGHNISSVKFGLDSNENNKMTSLIDVMAMLVNEKLELTFTYNQKSLKEEKVNRFVVEYIEVIRGILEHCLNKIGKEFTPSDFNVNGMTQEDLDMIF